MPREKVSDFDDIPELADSEIDAIVSQCKEPGDYVKTSAGWVDILSYIKNKHNSVSSIKQAVRVYTNGGFYCGDVVFKDKDRVVSTAPNGIGAVYRKEMFGKYKVSQKGEFKDGKPILTIYKTANDKWIVAKDKHDKYRPTHDANDLFISFVHRDDKDSKEDTWIAGSKAIADKYKNSTIVDLRTCRNATSASYGTICKNNFNALKNKVNLKNITDVKIRIEDHGGPVTIYTPEGTEEHGGYQASQTNYKHVANYIENLLQENSNLNSIQIELTHCHGTTLDEEGNDFVAKITEISKKYPNLNIFLAKTNEKYETYNYDREYKGGEPSNGLYAEQREYYKYKNGEAQTYPNKTAFRNDIKATKKAKTNEGTPTDAPEKKDDGKNNRLTKRQKVIIALMIITIILIPLALYLKNKWESRKGYSPLHEDEPQRREPIGNSSNSVPYNLKDTHQQQKMI